MQCPFSPRPIAGVSILWRTALLHFHQCLKFGATSSCPWFEPCMSLGTSFRGNCSYGMTSLGVFRLRLSLKRSSRYRDGATGVTCPHIAGVPRACRATRLEDSSALVAVLCGAAGSGTCTIWKSCDSSAPRKIRVRTHSRRLLDVDAILWRDRVALGNRLHGAV